MGKKQLIILAPLKCDKLLQAQGFKRVSECVFLRHKLPADIRNFKDRIILSCCVLRLLRAFRNECKHYMTVKPITTTNSPSWKET